MESECKVCKLCSAILKIEIINKGNYLRDFLIYMEDILRSMPGFEDMECTGKSRPRYDSLEYTVYGDTCPMECRETIQKIQALNRDGGYDISVNVSLDPCSTCKCVGWEALKK